MKFGFIAKHRGIWPAGWLCGALGVSRGGFYAWLTRPRSQRRRGDEELVAVVHGVAERPAGLVAEEREAALEADGDRRISPPPCAPRAQGQEPRQVPAPRNLFEEEVRER